MNELQEFHLRQISSNKKAQLTVGAVILVLLAGLGAHAYKLEVSAQPHYVVPNNHLPSP